MELFAYENGPTLSKTLSKQLGIGIARILIRLRYLGRNNGVDYAYAYLLVLVFDLQVLVARPIQSPDHIRFRQASVQITEAYGIGR